MSQPILSVIIPVNNRTTFLTEAIASAKRQVVGHVEIIVVDDGSENPVAGEIAQIAQAEHVRLIRLEENQGVSAARNAGLAQSTGRFVLFLDDDDWLEDGFVSGVLTEFDNETQVIIAKANLVNNGRPGFDSLNRYYNFLQEKYHKLSVNDFGYFLIYCPAIHCVIWKRSCFDQIHFNESIRYGEDREILLRMKAAGITMRSLDHLGGHYRISAGRNAKDTSFIDVILNDQLVTTPGERSYLYWLKGYLLFSDGKYLKGISEMLRSFNVPKIFMQQLVLFFRFRLIR